MKQLGNLAIVCAKRKDVMMCLYQGSVHVSAGGALDAKVATAPWDDDEKILKIVHEHNFGEMAEKRSA